MGYKLWQLFEKIDFQDRDKLIFQSMSPNELQVWAIFLIAIWQENHQQALC